MRTLPLSLCIAAFASTTLAPMASAEEEGKYLYGGFRLGITTSPDKDFEGVDNSGLEFEGDKSKGTLVGAYIGQNLGDWRIEFEWARRGNPFEVATIENPLTIPLAAGTATATGEQSSNAFMGNAHYKLGEMDGWKAYAGLGLGLANLKVKNFAANGVLLVDSRNWEPAGQAMLQVVKDLGNTEVGVGVRHFRTMSGRFSTEAGIAKNRFVNNEIFASLTWKFGHESAPKRATTPAPAPRPVAAPAPRPQPAPAPAPAPEPAPAPLPGPFMVFFDFDKTDLTADARSIIRLAATAFKDFGVARIAASGHTDKAGRDAYNDALAQRRAEAVRDALIAQGVPAGRISIRSYGEKSPLVSTNDGVREWQNRRVEIVLSR